MFFRCCPPSSSHFRKKAPHCIKQFRNSSLCDLLWLSSLGAFAYGQLYVHRIALTAIVGRVGLELAAPKSQLPELPGFQDHYSVFVPSSSYSSNIASANSSFTLVLVFCHGTFTLFCLTTLRTCLGHEPLELSPHWHALDTLVFFMTKMQCGERGCKRSLGLGKFIRGGTRMMHFSGIEAKEVAVQEVDKHLPLPDFLSWHSSMSSLHIRTNRSQSQLQFQDNHS